MISVIVPVYNAGPYLEELVRSCLSQTYADLELLLIDDGSTDGSGNTCDALAALDGRVRVFHKENGGQSSARNLGLEHARGDLIAFADHDDVLHPKMYETLVHALEQTGAKVSACQFQNTASSDIPGIDFSKSIQPIEMVPQETIVRRFFSPAWHIPVWNKLYRRELVEGLRFHSAMLGEDNLFSYRILKQCDVMAFCPTVLYFQRMHGNNFEFTGLRYMVDLIRAKETILQDIRDAFPCEYRSAQAKFLYECVRINNLYVDCGNLDYEAQRRQVYEMLCRNADGLLWTAMPAMHKLRFSMMKLLGAGHSGKKIIL